MFTPNVFNPTSALHFSKARLSVLTEEAATERLIKQARASRAGPAEGLLLRIGYSLRSLRLTFKRRYQAATERTNVVDASSALRA